MSAERLGASISIGPAVGAALVPTFEATPAMAKSDLILTGGFSGVVTEGSVRGGIENTMPYTLSRINLLRDFGTDPFTVSDLDPVEAVKAAESIIAQSQVNHDPAITNEAVLSPVEPLNVPSPQILWPFPQEYQSPNPDPILLESRVIVEDPEEDLMVNYIQTPKIQTERKYGNSLGNSAHPQTERKIGVLLEKEEIIEETRLVLDHPNKQTNRKEKREEILFRERMYVVDQPVLSQVLVELDQATEKAEKETDRQGLGRRILGSFIAKFMPKQHEGNTGGAVKPYGVDGTISARREAIGSKREFSSKEEVRAVALENRPVTTGENGEKSTNKEIRTTFSDHVTKPVNKFKEIVERRIIRKSIPVPISQQHEIREETSLKDFPDLEEVFEPKQAV